MKLNLSLNQNCLRLVSELARRQIYLLLPLFLSVLGLRGTFSFASGQRTSAEGEVKIIEKRLWESRQWEKLLFIPDRFYPSKRSMVDDPKFFLSVNGKNHPKEELLATWRSFFEPQNPDSLDSHPQCMFPARKRWILKQLALGPDSLPKVSCPRFETYLGLANYHGASLVFSNYFLGNPASMFGHTFLTFHTSRKDGVKVNSESNLFADVLNFSAMVDDSSSVFYPLKGLAGFFPGRFAMMPFYRKIQEYNNAESRDLWEYELKLTPDELEDAPYLIWELGSFFINYFYIDENCSQLMLSFLEALRPSLYLSGKLAVYSIPADTVRVVFNQPGLTGNISHKASSLSRYIYRLGLLNPLEREHLAKVIGGETKDFETGLGLLSKPSQAKVLDTAAEWIDYSEKVVGSHTLEKYGARRFQILKARSLTGVIDDPISVPAQSTPPHLGHNSGSLGLALVTPLEGKPASQSFKSSSPFELKFRPALHEIRSPSLGYSDELEILFLDFSFRKEVERPLVLEKFKFFSIMAIPKRIPFVEQAPWGGQMGFERHYAFQSQADAGKIYLKGAKGLPLEISSLNVFGFAMLGSEVFWSKHENFMFGPISSLGFFYTPTIQSKISMSADYAKYFNQKETLSSARANLSYAVKLNRDFELRAELDKENERLEAKINIFHNF